MARRKPSKAQIDKRNQAKKDILLKLEEGLLALQSSDNWKSFLKVAATLHNYSFNNILLAMQQREGGVTRLAGYGAWQKLGRQVIAGEKALKIMAPLMWKVEDKETGEKKSMLGGFRLVSVFDISQTEGEDLTYNITKRVEGISDLARKVELACKGFDIPVVYEDLEKARGYWHPKKKFIAIDSKSSLDDAMTARTFVHELAHALHGHGTEATYNYNLGELEAESTAFVVCDHFGIDTSDTTFGYISMYKGKASVDELKKSGTRIMKVAKKIINAIEANEVAV